MQVDASTGLIAGVSFMESPNRSPRPKRSEPELIVVHGISLPAGQFGGGYIGKLFTNQLDTRDDPRFAALAGLQVSAHLLIARDGHLTQFVSFDERAWHAGESVFQGRHECNDFSIGIELEGTDASGFRDIQYERLESVIRLLREVYPRIGSDRVVGHCHIAPGRKSDPGPDFDWGRLQRNLGITRPITQRRVLAT
ncbi:1,6-anhydro-N-acetylmuramyl-L-alanine amidase AmpD [Spiribacter insolitus]|uniref:1,6-anhydro-N-acetylmuramyl-L-alanine amidase AmpD n=1 Tax=Spiribacter insolitus TaxID=3122417 RepID=A0ABV3T793_9GAMM